MSRVTEAGGGVGIVVGDRAEAARRFRRFVVLDLGGAAVGVVVLAVVVAAVPGVRWLWPLLVATAVCVPLLAWSLRLYAAGRVDAAVMAVCATFWLELVVAPLMVPSLFGGFAVLMLWPVLFAIPYVHRATLRRIIVATAGSAVVAMVLAVRPDAPDISHLPPALLSVVFLLVGLLFLGLSLTVLYAYSGRLGEVVEGLQEANAALQESERSLEAKVARRTAQLEQSRQETARAHDEAVALSHELAAVFDNLGEGLLVIGPDDRITRVNRALEGMLARSGADLVGRPVRDVVPQLADIAPSDTQAAVRQEVELADGRLGRVVASRVAAGSDPAAQGSVVLVSDVTAEREVDRMKTEFISTVSHELRTPLTSILGFTKIIAKRLDQRVFPALPDPDAATRRAVGQVRGNLDIIVSEGQRLTDLINDVLDLAKMEAGRVDWRDEEIDVGDLVRQASAATDALFQERRLPLELDLQPDLPAVRGDPHRLTQVLINLLSNACKFTDAGRVTVGTRTAGPDVVVSVSDTGLGIAPADLAQLFDRFKQVGDTLTGKPQGTGLGLPICQEIVEHHGGRLHVQSEPGVGSTFSFAIPAVTPVAVEVTPVVDARQLLRDLRGNLSAQRSDGPPRILVVDDHEPVRQLLREELEGQGYAVHEARDGREAVSLAKSLRPDLITLDVLMPELDGFDVAAVLRRDPATMRIPIMIVSILGDEGRAGRIGVDRYLTKPVDTSRLFADVEALLVQGGTHRRVVVVDTDREMLQRLQSTLQQQGWEVTAVDAPDAAVAATRSAQPDVVIANAVVCDRAGLVDQIRRQPGMEQVVFVLFE